MNISAHINASINYNFRQLELFAHKCANFNYDFEFSTNIENAGKFNDVNLIYKNSENNNCSIFGCVKYRLKPVTLNFESLVLNDSEFCLYKFFISIAKTLVHDSTIQNLMIITNNKFKNSGSNTLELKCGKMGLLYLGKLSSSDIIFQNIGERYKFWSSDIVRDTLKCIFIACELLNRFNEKENVSSGILEGNLKFLQDNFVPTRYHKDYDWKNKNFKMLELALQLVFRRKFENKCKTENMFWAMWESHNYDDKLKQILDNISIREADMDYYKKMFDHQLNKFIDNLVFVTNLNSDQIVNEIKTDICFKYNIDDAESYYNAYKGSLNSFFSDGQAGKAFTLAEYKKMFKKIVPEFDSRFEKEFYLVKGLGYGGFGVVCKVQHKLDRCNYAVKRIEVPKKESSQRFLNEVHVLANLNHKNIVRYLDAWTERPPLGWQEEKDKNIFTREFFLSDSEIPMSISDSSGNSREIVLIQREYLYIKMELCQKVNLRNWLDKNKLETRMKEAPTIFYQIISAVNYVHMNGLIHRDLKPNNVLFDLEGNIKIGDFGLVTNDIPEECENGFQMTKGVGTPFYQAPEIVGFGKRNYNFKVDIYSLGIILFEMLIYFGTGSERISVLTNLQNGRFPENFERLYSGEYELIKMMLSTDPDKRPTTIGIMSSDASLKKLLNEQVDYQKYFFKLPPKEEREKLNLKLFK